jgi:hypothetical protein
MGAQGGELIMFKEWVIEAITVKVGRPSRRRPG